MRFCFAIALSAVLAGPAHSETIFHFRFEIPVLNADLGGLSAIDIAADGREFWMINDAGILFQGQFLRDAQQKIIGLGPLQQGELPVPSDLNFGEKIDSEGLAVTKTGRIAVSFEGDHSVVADISGPKVRNTGPYPGEIAELPENKGLEALAVSPTGTLFALPEYQDHSTGYIPVYALTTAGWVTVMRLPTRRGFLVTGADFGIDGHLYVLERRTRPFGFQTRVRQVNLRQKLVKTILHTGTGTYGNLEGIAIWAHVDGGQMMTLIADNNFLSLFPNEVIEFRITD